MVAVESAAETGEDATRTAGRSQPAGEAGRAQEQRQSPTNLTSQDIEIGKHASIDVPYDFELEDVL